MFAKFAGTPCISVGLAVWCPHFPSRSGPTWIWWFCPFWPPCRRRRSPDRRCCCCWAAAVGFCVSQLNAARFASSYQNFDPAPLWSLRQLEAILKNYLLASSSLVTSCSTTPRYKVMTILMLVVIILQFWRKCIIHQLICYSVGQQRLEFFWHYTKIYTPKVDWKKWLENP